MSNTDFVNSGSYLRTVFVFISGMTTFTGLAGGAGFLASGLGVTWGAGGGAVIVDFTSGVAVTGLEGVCTGCTFAPVEGVLATAGALAAGLDILLDIEADFLAGKGAGFLAAAAGATFFATGLAILLAAGAFLAFAPPDEWAAFEAVFFAGAIFLTLAVFLAGLAAFFLVAIQLGFFSNKHF
ncbi:MAG TPA: hypothetical protein VGS79_27365 [Puia sp.]|nr:hypothetical protein [Puia sp.]